jgi:UDP-N-acetylglucosamine pyrophosphorylase
MSQSRVVWKSINTSVSVFNEIIKISISLSYFLGLRAISEGQLSVLVLCGGQASRLGGDVPKGSLSLSLGGRFDTLISLQAAQIVKLLRMAKERFPNSRPRIPWLVF